MNTRSHYNDKPTARETALVVALGAGAVFAPGAVELFCRTFLDPSPVATALFFLVSTIGICAFLLGAIARA